MPSTAAMAATTSACSSVSHPGHPADLTRADGCWDDHGFSGHEDGQERAHHLRPGHRQLQAPQDRFGFERRLPRPVVPTALPATMLRTVPAARRRGKSAQYTGPPPLGHAPQQRRTPRQTCKALKSGNKLNNSIDLRKQRRQLRFRRHHPIVFSPRTPAICVYIKPRRHKRFRTSRNNPAALCRLRIEFSICTNRTGCHDSERRSPQ